MLKSSLFLWKIQTLRINNSGILRIKNAKFSRYCFYMNWNIKWNFQIRISVSLRGRSQIFLVFYCDIWIPQYLKLENWNRKVFFLKLNYCVLRKLNNIYLFDLTSLKFSWRYNFFRILSLFFSPLKVKADNLRK